MKRIMTWFSVISLMFLLTSCAQKDGSDFSDSSALQENRTEDAAGTESAEDTGDMAQTVPAKLTGSFAVTVRDIIPDYCLDDVTPVVAVVTCFQDVPFTVYVGEEMASQMIVGEQYVFEIEETDIGEIPQETFDSYPPSPEAAVPLYHLQIANIRIAEEEEWGLDSIHLQYVEVK